MSTDDTQNIPGFDETDPGKLQGKPWEPVSDRVIRVGIVGHGICQFGAHFGFQDHPNSEVVAVSDLDPERCRKMAEITRCDTRYPSLEEMLKDEQVEVVF
ncbi:MAG: Gfo/Idh/MocA family oxidoreductase, partial [Dehalococcoidia bacterium]|nr:Gfo/Idh/MocA family oxidoreductase [Dehalococcoidia bacterium]